MVVCVENVLLTSFNRRIFTPVAHIVRECDHEQTLTSKGKTYRIPAKTRCTISLDGVGSHRAIWGDDVYDFKPSRWMENSEKLDQDSVVNGTANASNLEPPVKGAFIPWSAGPRVCPGMKMAQVEFLCVVWTVFSTYRVEPSLKDGETMEQGKERIQDVVNDSSPRITLQMNKPTGVTLKWSRRK